MATMTTCDSRHRVKVPAAIPGRQYIPDGLTLIEVPQTAPGKPRRRMTREKIRAAMARCKIEVKGSWEELRALTREP
jgi:hypothetical protein